MDGDIAFEDGPTLTPDAQKAVTFFKGTPHEIAPTYGPEDVENLAETPLAYKELCEDALRELYQLTQKRKAIEKAEKLLKDEIKRLVGLDRGMIQRGSFGVKVEEKKGRSTTNWAGVISMAKCWAEDQCGAEGKKEIEKFVTNNTAQGSPTIAIQPYMVGSEPGDEDT